MENQLNSEKTKDLFNKAGKFFFFFLLVSFGYLICEIYHYTKKRSNDFQEDVKKSSEISIAINDQKQMMIIDRKSGKYNIYQDSVGLSIFNLYANMMQSQYKSNK